MNLLVPVENCTGCSACMYICPQNAIQMTENSEGFLYPQIDPDKCNACNLCIKKCPVKHAPVEKNNGIPTVYAAWTKDRKVLQESSSGGVFSELSRNIIEEGGGVIGAGYDQSMTVRHMAVEKWEDMKKLRGSKYVQSDIGNAYFQVEKFLNAGRKVLFSGTPCQVAGIYSIFGERQKNLLTCDLICKGVPSPKVFRMAVNSIENRYSSKVVNILFREKSFGWLHPMVQLIFSSRKSIREIFTDNHFNLGFQKNLYLRQACHNCPLKVLNPKADITIGDFWQLLKFQPKLINRGGTSAVLVNTERGQRLLKNCADNLELTKCPFEYIERESNLKKNATPSPQRDAFFEDLDYLSFEELTQKYIKPRGILLRNIARIGRSAKKILINIK